MPATKKKTDGKAGPIGLVPTTPVEPAAPLTYRDNWNLEGLQASDFKVLNLTGTFPTDVWSVKFYSTGASPIEARPITARHESTAQLSKIQASVSDLGRRLDAIEKRIGEMEGLLRQLPSSDPFHGLSQEQIDQMWAEDEAEGRARFDAVFGASIGSFRENASDD